MRLWLQQLNEIETPICLACSQALQSERSRRMFAIVSRLGDGVFWYSLIAVMPLVDGWNGARAGLHMLLTGAAVLTLYKALKKTTRRARPCNWTADVTAAVAPLDHYSFPSGHTLHAVSFTIVAVHYYPRLAWVLLPFTLLVAGSRVVLGLHYPSDVLAAAGIGLALAYTGILLVS
jgi:undecaprenyl-diphosphatase